MAYSEPCQTSMMKYFANIVHSDSCSGKLKLFFQYQLFTFSTFQVYFKYAFTPEVFILYKKV